MRDGCQGQCAGGACQPEAIPQRFDRAADDGRDRDAAKGQRRDLEQSTEREQVDEPIGHQQPDHECEGAAPVPADRHGAEREQGTAEREEQDGGQQVEREHGVGRDEADTREDRRNQGRHVVQVPVGRHRFTEEPSRCHQPLPVVAAADGAHG